MLVLTRRVNQVIRVGSDIELIVLAVREGNVRLGIKAPRNITVDREEIAERKRVERDFLKDGL